MTAHTATYLTVRSLVRFAFFFLLTAVVIVGIHWAVATILPGLLLSAALWAWYFALLRRDAQNRG